MLLLLEGKLSGPENTSPYLSVPVFLFVCFCWNMMLEHAQLKLAHSHQTTHCRRF